MIVKLLTEYRLEFLSLKGGCRGSSDSTLVNMSNCWKSHATAQMLNGDRVITMMYASPQRPKDNIKYIICIVKRPEHDYDLCRIMTISLNKI